MEPVALLSGFTLVLALYLLFVTVWYQHLSGVFGAGSGQSTRAGEPTIDRDAGIVECPHCGAENELGYTYCHSCIDKLPGSRFRTGSGTNPSQRGIF